MEDLELKEKIFEEYLQSDNTFACLPSLTVVL